MGRIGNKRFKKNENHGPHFLGWGSVGHILNIHNSYSSKHANCDYPRARVYCGNIGVHRYKKTYRKMIILIEQNMIYKTQSLF